MSNANFYVQIHIYCNFFYAIGAKFNCMCCMQLKSIVYPIFKTRFSSSVYSNFTCKFDLHYLGLSLKTLSTCYPCSICLSYFPFIYPSTFLLFDQNS